MNSYESLFIAGPASCDDGKVALWGSLGPGLQLIVDLVRLNRRNSERAYLDEG